MDKQIGRLHIYSDWSGERVTIKKDYNSAISKEIELTSMEEIEDLLHVLEQAKRNIVERKRLYKLKS